MNWLFMAYLFLNDMSNSYCDLLIFVAAAVSMPILTAYVAILIEVKLSEGPEERPFSSSNSL